MNARMPLATALRKLGDFAVMDQDGNQGYLPYVWDSFCRAVYFDAQVAHDIVMEQLKTKRLPPPQTLLTKASYPVIWMEWYDELMERQVGCLITEANPDMHANYTNR